MQPNLAPDIEQEFELQEILPKVWQDSEGKEGPRKLGPSHFIITPNWPEILRSDCPKPRGRHVLAIERVPRLAKKYDAASRITVRFNDMTGSKTYGPVTL